MSVDSTSVWRISTFLYSENIYIGVCTLPLGRTILSRATWITELSGLVNTEK